LLPAYRVWAYSLSLFFSSYPLSVSLSDIYYKLICYKLVYYLFTTFYQTEPICFCHSLVIPLQSTSNIYYQFFQIQLLIVIAILLHIIYHLIWNNSLKPMHLLMTILAIVLHLQLFSILAILCWLVYYKSKNDLHSQILYSSFLAFWFNWYIVLLSFLQVMALVYFQEGMISIL
jgi:hypothetical protein